MRRTTFCAAAALATLALAFAFSPARHVAAQAQKPVGSFEPATFNGLKWRNVGPNRGGRSIACTGVPSRPLEYYFGAVGGGLWKTTDGGMTWRPVTDGQIQSSSVGAVAVAESNPDIVYIGMGETEIRGNIMQGDGVYKSTDAGKTWTHVGLADTQAIAKVRVHPTNPDIVYVAAFGHPAAANDERGVFRSKDGGKTWQRVLFRNNKTGAIDLVIDRRNPSVVYASVWEAYRVSWQMSSGGPGSGLFRSTDGGDTWTELTRNPGMPSGVIGKIGVSVSGADSNRVFALVENENGGVFRSDDAGATWTKVNDERKLRQRAFYYSRIYADPKDRDTVYALNTGFYKSTDGGKTFPTALVVPHGDNHDLWIDPGNPLRMVNSNDGGGNVSVNGGETWTEQRFPTAQLYHVAITRDFPYHACGAQQDNSTACVPSDYGPTLRDPRDRAGNWLYAVGGGESGYIAPHPVNPDIALAGNQGAQITVFNRRTGQARDIQPYPRFFSGEAAKDLKERWQWTFPIVFSPQDPNVFYISSQHLWRTNNAGQSWEKISPDLTRADPKTLDHSGGPITHDENGPEVFGTIFTIAPSKQDANTVWTGSDDGLVYITRDGGKNWTNITPRDVPALARVSLVDASPHRPGAAYVAVKNYLQDDRAPYIFKTEDYGKTWTRIVSGIGQGDYVHAVREDPKRAGLLYAGTEHGIYVSLDDGASWKSLSLNLPDTQVSDIVVEGNDVIIATHGRSMWVLDNISVLRQITPETLTASVHLFTPADAIRRPYPAVIDYQLAKPAQRVTIDILDASGAIVRSFTSDAQPTERRGGDDDRRAMAARPSTNAGINRFVWDLRYEGATTFPGMILWRARPEQGPLAAPGGYQARLTVDGAPPMTRPFRVTKDPRLTDVTDTDLVQQFRLAMNIRNKVTEANRAVIEIRRIAEAVKDRVEKAKAAQVTTSAAALTGKLSEIEEEIYQVRNRSNQDPLNFPIKLNNRIAQLQSTVENADAKPTDQCYTVFEELSAELATLTGRLQASMDTELAALNRLLLKRKLEPIAPTAVNAKPTNSPTANANAGRLLREPR